MNQTFWCGNIIYVIHMQVTLDNILEKSETDESDEEVEYHHDDMKQLVICV